MRSGAVLLSCLLVVLTTAHGEIKTEENVLVLTTANFQEAIKAHKFILVEFYAPWCGHCKALAPEYAKAATELAAEGSELKLAKVDATEEQDLGERYEIRGYPTLKLFRDGEPSEYNGGRTAPEIIRWLKKKSGPPAAEIATPEELTAFKEGNEVVVVGLFKDRESGAAQAFLKVAGTSDDYPFGISSDDAVIAAAEAQDGQIVLFKKFDEKRNVIDGVADSEKVKEFVVANSLPLVVDFTHESASKIFGGSIKSHNLLFVDKTAGGFEDIFAKYRESAEAFRGKVLFVTINTENDDHTRILDFFGIKKSDKPQMRMIRLEEDMAKFKPDDETNLDPSVVTEFVNGVLEGRVKQHLLSQELPEDWDKTPVKVLVAKNFDEIVFDEKKTVLVEFYAPWCGHCKQLVPIYDQLGEHYKDSKDIVIAKFDATANELEHTKVGSFPTLKLYRLGQREPIEYTGERTFEGLKKFIESDGTYGTAPSEDVQEEEEKQEDDSDEHGPRDEL